VRPVVPSGRIARRVGRWFRLLVLVIGTAPVSFPRCVLCLYTLLAWITHSLRRVHGQP
jgi:hypothetical protein